MLKIYWITKFFFKTLLVVFRSTFQRMDRSLARSNPAFILANDFELASKISSVINLDFDTLKDKTPLCEIMSEEKSDKGGRLHCYTQVYYEIFKSLRDKDIAFFELGIGSIGIKHPSSMVFDSQRINYKPGASLRGWKRFFSRSRIYGADIDIDCLFEEDRISTYQVDQLSKESIDLMWGNVPEEKIDVIIDDGLHIYEANISFLENSFSKLVEGGYYIIEDVNVSTKNILKFYKYLIDNSYQFVIVKLPLEKKRAAESNFVKRVYSSLVADGLIVIRKPFSSVGDINE